MFFCSLYIYIKDARSIYVYVQNKLKLKFEGCIIIVGVGVGAAEVDDLAVGGTLGACVAGVSDIVIIGVVIGLFFWRTT